MTEHRILNSEEHRDLRIHTGASAELGDAVMACLTVPDEFRRVQACFPIVFRRDLATDRFSALALFGFTNGENLFLGDGGWDAPYKPLAQSIQPFLVGRAANGEGGQVHIDMEHPRVSTNGEGVRVFDEDGLPTPYLDRIAEDLGVLDAGYRASEAFFAALTQHDLLEPFTLEVPLKDGSKNSLVGFHIVNEERLRRLGGAALGELHAAGHLMPIFMTLASLSHFAELVRRTNDRIVIG